MNNIFKQTKTDMIKLESNYYLTTDNFKGVCLVFHEMRKKENKKGVKTDFKYEEKYFYPTVGQALSKYVALAQSQIKNVKEIEEKTEKILNILEDFKTKYKNW